MFDTTILINIFLGVVQGLTEFLPISSSGHLVLLHALFGPVKASDLAFDAFLHFATAFAIIVYFWRDIWKLILTFYKISFDAVIRFLRKNDENGTPITILGI